MVAHLGPFERRQNPSLLPISQIGAAQLHESDPFDQFCRNVQFQLENWVAGLDSVGQNDGGENQDRAPLWPILGPLSAGKIPACYPFLQLEPHNSMNLTDSINFSALCSSIAELCSFS